MTETYSLIKIKILPGDYRYVELLEDFSFYSKVLGMKCIIPAGFVFDLESVPLLRGTNPEAGAIHDYVCRKNSTPIISKRKAALVYREFQYYYDYMETGNLFNRVWDCIRREVKTTIVQLAWGYFHKFDVMATYDEIKK